MTNTITGAALGHSRTTPHCRRHSNTVARALRGLGRVVGVAPPSEKDFVKRVIGVAGDRVKCCDASGHVTVNGVALKETYVMPGDVASDQAFEAGALPHFERLEAIVASYDAFHAAKIEHARASAAA